MFYAMDSDTTSFPFHCTCSHKSLIKADFFFYYQRSSLCVLQYLNTKRYVRNISSFFPSLAELESKLNVTCRLVIDNRYR